MKPVFQSRTGEDGTCLSACVASIMELPESAVPELGGDNEWLKNLNRWLSSFGLRYAQVPKTSTSPIGYHIIEGISPRGGRHAVVGCDGRFVFDPHPYDGTGRGLRKEQAWGLLVPVSSARDARDMWLLRDFLIEFERGKRGQ